MKTPEEMAEEYLDQDKVACDAIDHDAEDLVKDAFLAGYKAAKQWISVKDRLPEINEGFIGFVQNREVCNCHRYQNHTKDDSPVFYAQTKTGLLICGTENISYWQPLPEAPKEER